MDFLYSSCEKKKESTQHPIQVASVIPDPITNLTPVVPTSAATLSVNGFFIINEKGFCINTTTNFITDNTYGWAYATSGTGKTIYGNRSFFHYPAGTGGNRKM